MDQEQSDYRPQRTDQIVGEGDPGLQGVAIRPGQPAGEERSGADRADVAGEEYKMESIAQRVCATLAVCFCWSLLALILVGDLLGSKH